MVSAGLRIYEYSRCLKRQHAETEGWCGRRVQRRCGLGGRQRRRCGLGGPKPVFHSASTATSFQMLITFSTSWEGRRCQYLYFCTSKASKARELDSKLSTSARSRSSALECEAAAAAAAGALPALSQHTSAYVSIRLRQHTSAYVSIRRRLSCLPRSSAVICECVCLKRQ